MIWDRSQGGPYSEDKKVGLTAGGISMRMSQRGIGAPTKAVGYMSDVGIMEATQEAFRNEEHGPEWASPST